MNIPKFAHNQYFLAALSIGATSIFCLPLSNTPNYLVVSFIMLFVISILATFMSVRPVLIAAILSSLLWNFLYIPPHYTFHIYKTEDILMFFMFFIIVLIQSVLNTKVRKQELLTREKEERTNSLFLLTKELLKSNNIENVVNFSLKEIYKTFSIKAQIILINEQNKLDFDNFLTISHNESIIIEWSYKNATKAGKFTNNFTDSSYTYYPLIGGKINPGILILEQEERLSNDNETFFNTFITQITNALERELLANLASQAKILTESDKLYKTLFNSVSHELRIPVATIMGASDSLIYTNNYSTDNKEALYHEIFTASLRLNRVIENLLNMSRLESGRLSINKKWNDINDLISKVTNDLKTELKPFRLDISIQENLPLGMFDFGLMEQVLYNLLINASQNAPATSTIKLNVKYNNDFIIFELIDEGPGFPDDDINFIFKKAYRSKTRKSNGLGLGLSIVKGFIEAHNGTITVSNQKTGGAAFSIFIPNIKQQDEYTQ